MKMQAKKLNRPTTPIFPYVLKLFLKTCLLFRQLKTGTARFGSEALASSFK
jgi:hypothetical protein